MITNAASHLIFQGHQTAQQTKNDTRSHRSLSCDQIASINSDIVSFANNKYYINRSGKLLSVISFGKKPQYNPDAFKVELIATGRYQKNIKNLFRTHWENDQPLMITRKKVHDSNELVVEHKKFGTLGIIPHDVGLKFLHLIDHGHCFSLELSDIEHSKVHNFSLNVKVNVKYQYKDKEKVLPQQVSKVINNLLAGKDTKTKVFSYQPAMTPEELLEIAVPQQVVSNIISEINKATSILLVSHKSPDGDAIGGVLAMRAALELLGKKADCSIDDDIDGLYRHKLPGIDKHLKKPSELLPGKKYDLVIVMDTPVPQRLGENVKYIKSAGKVIFIDHHELKDDQWKNLKSVTGLDLEKIEKEHLAWVRPEMPAVSEMIGGLIFKLLPEKTLHNMTTIQKQAIAKPLVAGMATDTEFFAKGEDQKVESMAKYLMNWARFSKKWVCKNIYYHLPGPALEKMHRHIKSGVSRDFDSSFASIQIPCDAFCDILDTARQYDKDVVISDVINELKYSGQFNALRKDKVGSNVDRIAAILIERPVSVSERNKKYTEISLRSKEGTDYAERIAKQIGGGGHPTMAAAQVIDHSLFDKVYDDPLGSAEKLTIERKIAHLVKKLRQEVNSNIVTFTSALKNKFPG